MNRNRNKVIATLILGLMVLNVFVMFNTNIPSLDNSDLILDNPIVTDADLEIPKDLETFSIDNDTNNDIIEKNSILDRNKGKVSFNSKVGATSTQSGIFESESVRVEQKRPTIISVIEDFSPMIELTGDSGGTSINYYDGGSTTIMYPLRENDGEHEIIEFTLANPMFLASGAPFQTIGSFSTTTKLKVTDSNGILEYDFRALTLANSSWYPTSTLTGTFDLSQGTNYVDSEGYVTLSYYITVKLDWVSSDWSNTIYTGLNIFTIDNSYETIATTSNGFSSVNYVTKVKLENDKLIYTKNDIISNLRFQTQNIDSDIFKSIIDVENFDYNVNITIYAPLYMELVNSNPVANYQIVNDNYVFYSTIPSTYSFEFVSGSGFGRDYTRQKQILAIKDVTPNYLQDPSFENGWQTDWTNLNSPYEFSNVNLNYTIVSDGISSLRLSDSVYGTSGIALNLDAYTEYYLKFDYYASSDFTGTLTFLYGDDSEADDWMHNDLDTSVKDRWITYFLYIPLIDYAWISPTRTVEIEFRSGSGTVFFDNFFIGEVSTTAITTAYNSLFIETKLNEWTSYGLFPSQYENVTLQLRDRTANTIIDSFSGYTDINGIVSWTWNGKVEEKEYEVMVFALDSHFGVQGWNFDILLDTAWNKLGIGSAGGVVKNGDVLDFNFYDITGSTSYFYTYPNLNDFDFSNVDVIVIDMIINESETIRTGSAGQTSLYSTANSGGADLSNNNYGSPTIDTIHSFYWLASDDWNNVNENGLSVINRIYSFVMTPTVVGDWFQVKWLDFKAIKSQKYYFTPDVVSETDYAIKELSDAWDFSEGDLEDWEPYSSTYTLSVENGYLKAVTTATGSDGIVRIYNKFDINDYSYYDTIHFRMKSNDSNVQFVSSTPIYIYSYLGSGNDYGYDTTLSNYNVSNNWIIYEVDINDFTSASTWDGSIGSISLVFKRDYIHELFIDYVELVHKDSSLEKGYAWEFEENGYKGFKELYSGERESTSVTNGLLKLSITRQWGGIKVMFPNIITGYDVWIRYKKLVSSESSTKPLYLVFWDSSITGGYGCGDYPLTNKMIGDGNIDTEFQNIIFDSDTCTFDQLHIRDNIDNLDTDYSFNFIRLIKTNPTNLYEADSYFVLQNENDYYNYNIWIDEIFQGVYSTTELIQKNLSVGTHTIRYQAFDSTFYWGIFLPSTIYEYSYSVYEPGIMKLIYYNQKSESIDFDNFKTYLENVRAYDQYYYFTDTSQTFNLTITDLFDNILYQDTSESFERFKEILFTLNSVKILNVQESPVYLYITRSGSGLTYSEWILANEIIKYELQPAEYNFTIVYSDDVSGFSSAVTNGTTVNFIYTVSSDTALMVSGNSVQDVFNNLISLQNDLDSVNSSIHSAITSQTNNITISIDNTNTNIDNQTNNIIIKITNSNSTLGTQLNTITTDISNMQSNITVQINDISSQIDNLQTNITIQYNNLNQAVINVQTNQTLQYNTLNSMITNFESSMDSQINSIYLNITNMQTNMTLQFNDVNTNINNVNSSINSQFNTLTNLINNFESSMDTQFNEIYLNITNVNSSINTQFNSVQLSISNLQTNITIQYNNLNQAVINVQTNQTLQYNTLNSMITNFESSMDSQINSIYLNITNMQTNMTLQFNDVNTNINNNLVNLTIQNNNLETNIININSTLFTQNLELLSSIQNTNSTLYSQNLLLLNDLRNTNSTLYNQTIRVLDSLAELQGLYRVHFVVIDQLGLGLNFETVLVKVNGTQILDQDIYYQNNSYLNVEAYDYFNILLFNQSFAITSSQTINISIVLFDVHFRNSGNYTSYIKIFRNEIMAINTTVSPNSEISLRMTSGDYNIAVYYFDREIQDNTKSNLGEKADYGYKLYKTSSFSVSAKLPTNVDVSSPLLSQIQVEESGKDTVEQFWNGFTSAITVVAVGSIFATTMVYLLIKEGWVTFKVGVLKKAPADSILKPNVLERPEDLKSREYNKRYLRKQ